MLVDSSSNDCKVDPEAGTTIVGVGGGYINFEVMGS